MPLLSFSGTASSTDSPPSARNAPKQNTVMDRIRGKCGEQRNEVVVPRCHTWRQSLMWHPVIIRAGCVLRGECGAKTTMGGKGLHSAAGNCGVMCIICSCKSHVAYISNNISLPYTYTQHKAAHIQRHKHRCRDILTQCNTSCWNNISQVHFHQQFTYEFHKGTVVFCFSAAVIVFILLTDDSAVHTDHGCMGEW